MLLQKRSRIALEIWDGIGPRKSIVHSELSSLHFNLQKDKMNSDNVRVCRKYD
jgi:hypothetical protein